MAERPQNKAIEPYKFQKGKSGNPNGRPKKTRIFDELGITPYDTKELVKDVLLIAAMTPHERQELAAVGAKDGPLNFRGIRVTSHQVMVARKWGQRSFDKLYAYILPKPEKTIKVKTTPSPSDFSSTAVTTEEALLLLKEMRSKKQG